MTHPIERIMSDLSMATSQLSKLPPITDWDYIERLQGQEAIIRRVISDALLAKTEIVGAKLGGTNV